jgi:hypothetical protein
MLPARNVQAFQPLLSSHPMAGQTTQTAKRCLAGCALCQGHEHVDSAAPTPAAPADDMHSLLGDMIALNLEWHDVRNNGRDMCGALNHDHANGTRAMQGRLGAHFEHNVGLQTFWRVALAGQPSPQVGILFTQNRCGGFKVLVRETWSPPVKKLPYQQVQLKMPALLGPVQKLI